MKLGMIHINQSVVIGEIFRVSVPVKAVLLEYNKEAGAFMGYHDVSQEQNDSLQFVWLPTLVKPEDGIFFHLSDEKRLQKMAKIDGKVLYLIVPRGGCSCR